MQTTTRTLSRYALRSACPTCVRRSVTDHRTVDFSPRSVYIRARRMERAYALRLRSIAQIVDRILRGFDFTNGLHIRDAEEALRQYAMTLTPWATAVASRMIAEVAQRDERAWFRVSNLMGKELRKLLETAPVGQVMKKRLQEQVVLITSLPREAAERVHHLAQEGRIKGTRADTLAAQIMETGQVTQARANLIARTETSRTATELTVTRALHIGSTHFRWITVGDTDVRPTHKKLNGRVFRWDEPPECDPGKHALPGAIFNCRCYPEPILPGDDDFDNYR